MRIDLKITYQSYYHCNQMTELPRTPEFRF